MKRRPTPLFLRIVTPLFWGAKAERLHPAPKTTFILSTGRTGTVYLADLLNQTEGVLSVHEPKPSRVLNAWTTAFLEGLIPVSDMAAALAGKRRKSLGDTRVKLYIESNNFISGFADALDQVFDNPTVIHIIRDPRDFVTSLINRGDASGIRGLFNKYVPFWAYVPTGLKKRDLSDYTRPAYRWAAMNNYLEEYGKTHQNYHRFKFEDIFNKKDNSALLDLLSAAGLSQAQIKKLDFTARQRAGQPKFSLLDRPSDSSNQSTRQHMKPWREWAEADARQVQEICGNLMKRYGYGGEREWQNKIHPAHHQ
jgi:hypothetical protein